MNTTKGLENQEFVNVGVDLAKNVFQVAYEDPHTSTMVNRQLNRSKFDSFLKDSKIKFKVTMDRGKRDRTSVVTLSNMVVGVWANLF
jgi:hypothetical protein